MLNPENTPQGDDQILLNQNIVLVKAEDLVVGMYVQSLDRDWSETDFMFQGFLIEDEFVLDNVKRQCASVMISVAHSTPESTLKLFPLGRANASKAPKANLSTASLPVNKLDSVVQQKSKPLASESSSGKNLHKKPDHQSHSWLADIRNSLNSIFNGATGSKIEKSNFDIEAVDSSALTDAIEHKRIRTAGRIRKQFINDQLLSEEVMDYKTTKSIKEEVQTAISSQAKLSSSVSATLTLDIQNSEMNEVITVAKEALAEVVESVSRNPDAMQLISKIKDFDKHSYQHALDVALMMIAFGRELCLPKEDLVEVGLGGLLHDIGEIKPPDGSATARIKNIMQFKIYKEHVEAGVKLILKEDHSEIVKQIVANHHERYDGSGYPKGLKANELGFYGHMIAIVDTYVSLTTGRCCDKPATPSLAMGYLIGEQGKSLHPALVNLFVQLIGVYPVGSLVKLSTGDIGVVMKQNSLRRLRPVVMIVMNKGKELLKSTVSIDLLTYSEPTPLNIISELPHGYHGIKVEDYII